ncbi:MAG: hypothetical protein J7L07_07495 [Candidatus Odinarchaeota archaeon]|nr:hypothetical protein [Candidatus Odinarchaeota archaeon]
MKISEAQNHVRKFLSKYKIKRSPLASLLGVYEELGELTAVTAVILENEGFKKKRSKEKLDYLLAEVLFELLKLSEDCKVDLESAFIEALKDWEKLEPLWI